MAKIKIECLARTPMLASYPSVTHLGCEGGLVDKQEIIEALEKKTHSYFIEVNGKQSDVEVWQHDGGTHVRSHSHGVWNDDLLKLPVCMTPALADRRGQVG